MNNTVIEVLDMEHGKKVIEYFKSKGVDTKSYKGQMTKRSGASTRFYGVIDQRFSNYSERQVVMAGAEIITLPEEPEYPKVMEVGYNEDFRSPLKRVVFMEKNGIYIAWAGAENMEEAEYIIGTSSWPYARDIEPEPEPEPDTWYAVLPDTNTDNIDPQANAIAIFRNKRHAKWFRKEVCVDNFIITETKTPSIEEAEKTIREWLETLPDGYRERALKNLTNINPALANIHTCEALSNAIMHAFEWRNTPEEEGSDFWDGVYVWADGSGELPQLPEDEK